MRNKPYWKDDNRWVCPKHLPSVKIPSSVSTCWFSNCSSVRPPLEKPKPIEVQETALCSYHLCKKGDRGGRAPRRKNSKYCSVLCKNNLSKYNIRQRRKKLKEQ